MVSEQFKKNRTRLIQVFCDRFKEGERFSTISQARKLATKVLGEPVRPGEPLAKAVEEAIEQAVILSAKQIIAQENFYFFGETFDKLVGLYNRQPTLGTRTSTSIAMQAYSTTVPLAFLASKLAGITTETSVYEPTAGRGALLLLTDTEKVFANELDPDRALDLKAQGYRVTQQDATQYRPPESVDVVIANPPFSRRKKEGKVERFSIGCPDTPIVTSELDQVIAWKALEAMKDDGRAVLIIGSELGADKEREQKYSTTRAQKFFFNLYRQYKVEDHFTADGKLYSRQGAAFPVDIIVISGRKLYPHLSPNIERGLPSVDLPRVYNSYEELKSILTDTRQHYERDTDSSIPSERPSLGTGREREPSSRPSDAQYRRDSRFRALPDVNGETTPGDGPELSWQHPASELAEPDTSTLPGVSQHRDLSTHRRERGSPKSARGKPTTPRETERGRTIPTASGERSHQASKSHRSGNEFDARGVANPSNTVTPPIHNMSIPSPTPAENNPSGQVPYRPRSTGKGLDSYVPQNLETPIQTALDDLEKAVGNVDEFVTDKLNFGSIEKLHQALAAEQVDGLGLAIRNLQQGKAALIGDDTGLGKGRQMAGAIKYALETGNIPIFITKDPGLYADMVRDLTDIGLDASRIRPFMTNSSENIPLPDGRTLKTSPTAHQRELNQMMQSGELLPQYNMIFSTYSQLQTVKGEDTSRRQFLHQLADRSIMVLDEAHEAGGSANEVNKRVPDRALFTRMLVSRAEGVFFASATATKRPDVMDLYALRMNVADITSVQGLQSTLERGGTPLQQVATTMMAQDGQYIRRARTYDGVEVGSQVVETAHRDADQLSEIMREILKFDKDKQLAVEALHKEAKAVAKGFGTDSSTGLSGAKSTSFSSIMWNVVDQAALARKADAVADYAISVLEADEKPFIGLSNTMGSFLDQYVKGEEISSGDPIPVSFQDVLARYLERSRDVTIKDYNGRAIDRRPLTDSELGQKATAQYQKAEKLINQASFSQMPVSPIDWIRYRIESAGYRFGELTGRKARLEYDADGNATYQSRSSAETSKAAKLDIIQGFNSGKIDVGLGNRSASTGYSMHASEKFSDQRRRHFLIAQPERDINVFKQFMGRFHRTGQVNAPKISLIVGNTPDEKRPAAVLAKKLASLNANTTAARQGGIDFSDIPDYLNEVGDSVVSDMMRFDPDLSERLYDPIYVTEDSNKPVVGAVAKVTGCLPILPVVEQEAFYQQLDTEYQSTLERYKALGENPLEATSLDLDARTLGSVDIVAQQEQSSSVFAQGIRAEIVDAKVQSKPKPQLEVINDIRTTLGLSIVRDVEQHNQDEVDTLSTQFVDDLHEKTKLATEHHKRSKVIDYSEQENDPEKRLGKIDKLQNRLTKQLDTLSQIRRFRPGRTVRVVASNDRVFYGAITAVKKRGQSVESMVASANGVKENPAIPSRWEVVIALADAERQISLPLSKMNTQNGGAGTYTVSIAQFSLADGDIYKMFDERQGGDREVRTLLKGNLLRLAETVHQSKGDLVVATMSNGQPEPVLLMEAGFNLEQEMQTTPVVLPTADHVRQFMQVTRNTGIVKTLDDSITFKVLKSGGFALQTGKPRKDIFLDSGLRDAANSDFVSVGDRMEARISDDQLDLVIDYLKEGLGKPVAAFTDHAAARDLLGIQLPEVRLADTVADVITREGLAPSIDMGNLEALRQQVAQAFEAESAVPPVEDDDQADAAATADRKTGAPENTIPSREKAEDESSEQGHKDQALPKQAPEAETPVHNNAIKPTPVPSDDHQAPIELPDDHQAPIELQPSSKHRLLCEKRVVKFLQEAGIAPLITANDDFHMKIENEPYIPLVVEAHSIGDEKLVYLTHYIQYGLDTVHDGEMVFKLRQDGHLSFEESAARGPCGEVRSYDKSFAAIFSQNILEQGFGIAARQQLDETPTTESTTAPTETLNNSQDVEQDALPNIEVEDSLQEAIPEMTEEEAFTDQVIQDFDGDEEAIINGILDGDIRLPSEETSPETIELSEHEDVSPTKQVGNDAAPSLENVKDEAQPVVEGEKVIAPENPPQELPPLADKLGPLPPTVEASEQVSKEVPDLTPIENSTNPIKDETPVSKKPYTVIKETPEIQPVGVPSPPPQAPPHPQPDISKQPTGKSIGPGRNSQNPDNNQEEPLSVKDTLKKFLGRGLRKIFPSRAQRTQANESQRDTYQPNIPPKATTSEAVLSQPDIKPSLEQPNATEPVVIHRNTPSPKVVSIEKDDVQRAIKAAHYVHDPAIHMALEKLSAEQVGSTSLTMPESLWQEALQTRSLARLKLQNELATQITPLAHKLIQTAEKANLVTVNNKIKQFRGKHYSVRSAQRNGDQHIEVRCRRGAGYIYAVNGQVQKNKGLQIKDRERFVRFAAKSPEQLKQIVGSKKQKINSGISQ